MRVIPPPGREREGWREWERDATARDNGEDRDRGWERRDAAEGKRRDLEAETRVHMKRERDG